MSRRTLLKAGAASGALMMADRAGALDLPLGPTAEFSTSRRSPLFPGMRLAHADLHNHTLYSDGRGDPAAAFASMSSAGLDVAALTDHSTVQKALGLTEVSCDVGDCPDVAGLSEPKWAATRRLADEANVDGVFTAIRGFEWSSPTLGHVNVWFSETWTDPLSTVGNTTGEGVAQFLHEVPGLGPALAPTVSPTLDAAVRATPARGAGMRLFYEWLARDPGTPVVGGGLDGLAGFNHPGREPGRFGYFAYDARLRDRLVSMEVFNRGEDYLFEGTELGFVSPLTECLDAGWKVGLLGVSDEHGTDWGYPDGKGRTGLYVKELTRAGVREAMQARRFFATRLRGLRLGATIGGVPMGGTLVQRGGPLVVKLDVDRGPEWVGKPLRVQVVGTGRPVPTVLHDEAFTVPQAGLVSFTAEVPKDATGWLVVRITDPEGKADSRARGAYAGLGTAIAYASPVYLA